ncbi:MAG: hypothetical protein ACREPT_10775 [Rudaea sp.]
MTEVLLCEVCQEPGASRIQFAWSDEGIAVDGQWTGHAETIEVCDAHRQKAMRLLVKHVLATFGEQHPIHRQLHEISIARDAQARVVRETAQPLLDHAGRYEVLGDPPDPPEEIVAAHREAVEALNEIERQRRELVAQATEISDKRAAHFRASLKD